MPDIGLLLSVDASVTAPAMDDFARALRGAGGGAAPCVHALDEPAVRGDEVGDSISAALWLQDLDDEAVERVGSLLGELGASSTWLDRGRSTAVVGARHVVFVGERSLMLAYGITRRADVEPREFRRHWSQDHAELARRLGLGSDGYQQLHGDPELSTRVNELGGFSGPRLDGIAMAFYDGYAELAAAGEDSAAAAEARADEEHFIDHDGASALVIGTVGQ
jgi:hypothetical protein